MKSKIVAAFVVALFAVPAFADSNHHNNCIGASCNEFNDNSVTNQGGQGGVGVGVGVGIGKGGEGGAGGDGGNAYNLGIQKTSVSNDLNNQQQQQQKQAQEAEAKANSASVSGAAASNKGNSQTINTYNPGNINYSGKYTVKSAPGFALGGPASGPCNGFSGGIAGSGIGFGFAANTSTVDEGCSDRETARMFGILGEPQTGLEILKTTEVYKRYLERKAEVKKAEADLLEQENRVKQASNPIVPETGKPFFTIERSTPKATQTASAPTCYKDEMIAYRMDAPVCK